MKHLARKRFGQNFLIDLSVVDNIIRAIDPERGQSLIEIGPGLSALTAPLIQRAGHLTAIEIDRDLVKRLQQKFTPEQLTVIEADVLTVDFKRFGTQLRLVGNLPYNISSPLLFHLVDFAELVVDQHFMLQKEVVERMVAKPGEANYGRLSVMLQARYKMYKVLDVPPDAFDPAPRVDSAVVRMIPLGSDRPQAKSHTVFEKIVQQAFSQRRKMLRRCLSEYAERIDWQALNIPETARAETLTVTDFIRLADALTTN